MEDKKCYFRFMKNSKICPKCNSSEIYTNEGNNNRGDRCTIPVTGWSKFFVAVYVCMHCGYVEEYMADTEWKDAKLIENLKEVWRKV